MQRARPARSSVKRRRQDGGGRTGQDGVGPAQRIQPREDRALDLHILRRVLLHMNRRRPAPLPGWRRPHAGAHLVGSGVLQQLVAGQIGQQHRDIAERLVRRGRLLVPQRDRVTGAGKADGPGPPDKA